MQARRSDASGNVFISIIEDSMLTEGTVVFLYKPWLVGSVDLVQYVSVSGCDGTRRVCVHTAKAEHKEQKSDGSGHFVNQISV